MELKDRERNAGRALKNQLRSETRRLLCLALSASVAVTTLFTGLSVQAAGESSSAPAAVEIIDTSQPEEAKTPENALKENVLSRDLAEEGTQYDAAGLLTYKIEGGEAIITSCDPAVQGELYIPDYINGCPVTAIADYAFLYCANLTALTLPVTVTDIGDYAFCYCTQIASVTAGGTASSGIVVGDHAFYRCYDLKKLDYGYIKEIGNYAFAYSGLSMTSFKEGLTSIGAYAFEGCSELTTVTLPSSLDIIGDFAFASCDALTYVTFPSTLTDKNTGGYIFYDCDALTSISPSTSWTKVPDGIFAKCDSADPYCVLKEGMTEIGHGAFYYCPGIKENLVIPSTVKRIGSCAFQTSGPRRDGFLGTAISSISFPDGLEYIGANAFVNSHLKNGISIPDSVEEIGANAFASSELSGRLELPSSLKVLGSGAFSSNSLTDVEISAKLSRVGDKVFYGNTSLVNVTIDSGSDVSGWGTAVFQDCKSLENIKLPSSWTLIPSYMFAECVKLSDVNIPSGVTEIGARAFLGCTALKDITLPSGLVTIGDAAFASAGVESATFGSSVTYIGQSAFYSTYIEKVSLPSSLKTIGELAFGNCYYLVSLDIAAGKLESIGKNAFQGCTSLKTVSIGDGLEVLGENVFTDCGALETVRLPGTLKYIGETTGAMNFIRNPESTAVETSSSCFSGCYSLKSINLPEGLLFIGDYTFANCYALKDVTLPKSLVYMGGGVFKNSGLEKVTLENGISARALQCKTWYRESVFVGCSKLTSINIPTSWTTIPKGFLYGCTGSLTIDIPSGVTEIGQYAFRECTGLTSVSIPDSVTVIGERAFYGSGLTSLTIPDSVTEENLGEYAIGACTKLVNIKLPSSWKTLPDGLFQNNKSVTEYTVPDNFTSIGKGAFSGSSLTKINMPESITSIGDEAFKGCTALTSVGLPKGLTSLGEAAFDGCTSLTQLTVPASLKEISPLAFASCSSLKNVIIESGVETIDNMAFSYCNVLTSVTVPDSVVNIGYGAFYGSNPGVLTLVCSAGSAAAVHAKAVLYLNSSVTTPVSGIIISKLYSRSFFDKEGKLFHGAYYYEVEYKGLTYHIEASMAGINAANGWRRDYCQDFTAQVRGLAASLKDVFNIADLVIDDTLAGSSIPVTSVYSDVFADQKSIKTVKLGKNISSIGNRAFSGCTNLVSVDLSATALTDISEAFENCTLLRTIKWPVNMKTIGKYAFRGCTSLTSLDFSNTKLEQIGKSAFEDCSGLRSVKFREGLELIDDTAFTGTALTAVYLPASLAILQPTAFDSKKLTYHFTGDATKIQYYWIDNNGRHYDYVLPLLLENRASRVGQFFGKGLDNQDTYFISTGTAGLNVPYGMQSAAIVFGIGGVPVGDPSSTADGELSSQASHDSVSGSMPEIQADADTSDIQEELQQEPQKVYEVVKDAISDNPMLLALTLLVITIMAGGGGMRRYGKSRRDR